jgi:ribosomal protein L7/L12
VDARQEVEIFQRITALERKVDLLMRTAGAGGESADGWGFDDQPGAMDPSDLLPLVQSGNKIQAIQQYRQRTGLGLAESKAAIDRLEETGG